MVDRSTVDRDTVDRDTVDRDTVDRDTVDRDTVGRGTVEMGVRELRAALAGAVRRAEAGERIVVTVGGRPAAQLAPLTAGLDAAGLDDLVARGLVVRAAREDRPSEPAAIVAPWAGARLDRVLAEVR